MAAIAQHCNRRPLQIDLSCPACITLTHARAAKLVVCSACCQLAGCQDDAMLRGTLVALEFMLGNSTTKLPARCMLGRRGQFEGVADWLPVLPV